MRRLALACALLAGLSVTGCARMDQSNKYTLTGAGVGAAAGASISAGLGHPFLGTALVGGLVGGTLGFVYGQFWAEEDEPNKVFF